MLEEQAMKLYLPNLFILRSLRNQHECWDEVFKVDTLHGATASVEEPLGDVGWRSLAQHLLQEGILAEKAIIRSSRALKGVFDAS